MSKKTLVTGFDGFIDTLASPLQLSGGLPHPTIASLGQRLAAQQGSSCSIELGRTRRRAGGNAPILAKAAARLGMEVSCIGTLGLPADPLFTGQGYRALSFASAGSALALEFDDGKVFLSEDSPLEEPAWQAIRQKNGNVPGLLRQADVLAFVNWSELRWAQPLWQDVFEDVFAGGPPDKGRTLLFDLADCSRRPRGELEDALALMGRYSRCRQTLLSLNGNEAGDVSRRFLGGATEASAIARELQLYAGVDTVVVHTAKESVWYGNGTLHTHTTRYVEKPKQLTGAGDHFNAALCYGISQGWPPQRCLVFANTAVYFYITRGQDPGAREVARLQQQQGQ